MGSKSMGSKSMGSKSMGSKSMSPKSMSSKSMSPKSMSPGSMNSKSMSSKSTGSGSTGSNRKNTAKKQVEPDLRKIFLTPPNTKKEKIMLLVMLVVTFVMFFGPICFSPIPPVKGILLACMPALSLSWGWMVFLRSLFRKSDFSRG